MALTVQNGALRLEGNALGTGQACCCGDDNSCTTDNDCGCYVTWPVDLQPCSQELEDACNSIGGTYVCNEEDENGECFGWLDDPECLGARAVSSGLWFSGGRRPCCGNQCCQEEFDEYLDIVEGYPRPDPDNSVYFTCCDGVCSMLGFYFDENLDQYVFEECPP